MHLMPIVYKVLWFAGEAFWIWMLIDCILNDPDKYIWVWILLFANIPGAIVYFFVRQPVSMRAFTPKFFTRLSRGGEINQAELTVYNTPNAYNYSVLGDLYFETGNLKKAGIAYTKSLELDPNDLKSLWGAVQIDLKNKDFEKAKPGLEKIVKKEPDYKYGDASVAYARALFETHDLKNAKKQLEIHVEKHSHPEAKLMLAQIREGEGDKEGAKKILEEALMDIKGSPGFYYNKNRKWIGKIKAMLRKIKWEIRARI